MKALHDYISCSYEGNNHTLTPIPNTADLLRLPTPGTNIINREIFIGHLRIFLDFRVRTILKSTAHWGSVVEKSTEVILRYTETVIQNTSNYKIP